MKFKKVLFIMSMVLCFTIVTPAHANNFSDAANNSTLTIEYKHEDMPMEGVLFSLYKVAEMSSNLEFTWTEQFESYSDKIKLDALNSSGWKETAETLAAYVQYESFFPIEMKETDNNGIVKFPEIGNLSMGLYLVVGQKHSTGGRTYSVMPTLVCLPNRNDDNTWIGNVVIHPKYMDIGEASEIEVIKQWNDNNSSKRPESILVELMMDGEVVQAIELNRNNSWRHKFENLETGHEWKAVEKNIPEDYVVSITTHKSTLIIKNTLEIKEKLPELEDTGVLWWPVPILLVCGLIFILIGLLINKKNEGLHEI